MGLQPRKGNGGLKRQPPEKGETASRRFKLGRLQRKILSYILQNGLRRFKPHMIPVHHNGKEVAEALARLMKHNIVRRLSHGYYEADLDKIKQLSLSKKLEFPPIRQIPLIQPQQFPPIREPQQKIPPITALAPASPPTAHTQPNPKHTTQSTTKPSPTSNSKSTSSRPTTSKKSSKPSNSVVCNDMKLSKYVDCSRKIGVVIGCSSPLQETLYDNVRGITVSGRYVHGDKGRLLRAEDLTLFSKITYAELSAASHSDYFEDWGVLKIYFKCIPVSDCKVCCSDFTEWMPPKNYIEVHGIARANYDFRHYILPAALKVIQRAIDVLSRRLN